MRRASCRFWRPRSSHIADTVLTPETIHARLEAMSVLVAVDEDDRVLGTIAHQFDGSAGHIRGMAVDPGRQGSGVADLLLQSAESTLLAGGCRRVTLGTTEYLQRAIRFYERNGYRRSGYVADFFGMPLVEYEKTL
jgi:GNAT superfamily N-acetyltransferase